MSVDISLGRTEPHATSLHGWILVSSCWLAVIGAVLIAPVLPMMQKHFADLPNADVLVVIAMVIPALIIALVSPMIGSVVDVLGRKRFYIIAIVIYALAGVAPFWLDDLYAIIASRVVVGAGEAAISTIATALTADYFEGDARQKWLSIQTGSASIVAVFMFGLGGALGGTAFGWRTPFLVYAFPIILVPLISALLWEPKEKVDPASGLVGSQMPFPWRAIGHVCAMSVFASVMFFVVPVQMSFLLNARGVTAPEVIGLSTAVAQIGVPVGAFIFHRLAKWPIIRLLTLAFALLAIGFIGIVQMTDLKATVAAAFIASMGGGIALPLLITWTMARLPYAQRGRGAGGFMGSFFLGNFISPIVVAAIGANASGLVPAIGVMGWACAVATVIAFIMLLGKIGPTESVQTVDMHMPLPH